MGIDLTTAMLAKLVLAAVLGGLIGLEREVHGRPAGFRTHLMVSLGSCLFVLTSIHFYQLYGRLTGSGPMGVDPARIAAQVVTGIGFLGAGAIIREKASIRGLTTAACLWVAAALGMAVGAGMYVTATAVTGLALVSLLLLKKVENRLKRDSYASVTVWSADLEGQLGRVEKILADARVNVLNVRIEKDRDENQVCLEFDIKIDSRSHGIVMTDGIATLTGVRKVRLD